MIRSRARWGIALVLVLGLVAAACGSDTKKGSSSGGSTSSTTKPAKQLAAATLAGSGSTFQQAFNEAVIAQFKELQPAVTVTYAGGGSGQGQTDLQAGTKQWAGTDSLIKAADLPKYTGGTVLYFPTVAAPITLSYNLSGVSKLNLSPDTIAGIFQNKITKWDDTAIKTDNPNVNLPSTAIVVAHRAEPSGTTANFTQYLTLAAPTAWTLGTDKTVAWPSGQQAGNANSGVAQIVKDTSGAIGYVDYSDAKAAGLTFAAVKNASGKFIAPSLESAKAALAGSEVATDVTYNPLNAKGAAAYPITSPTFVILYQKQADPAVAAALRGFVGYMLGDGQSLAESVDFTGLPPTILAKAKAQIVKIGT